MIIVGMLLGIVISIPVIICVCVALASVSDKIGSEVK